MKEKYESELEFSNDEIAIQLYGQICNLIFMSLQLYFWTFHDPVMIQTEAQAILAFEPLYEAWNLDYLFYPNSADIHCQ